MLHENADESDQRKQSTRISRLLRLLVRGIWRPLSVIAIIAIVIWIIQPARLVDELGELRDWLDEQGVLGFVLVLALYVLAAVAIVPQAALKIAMGGLYGGLLGVIMASIGSTLGATACFLIARYVSRGSLVKTLRGRRRIQRLDERTRKHGALIVAISRLVPLLPGNLINYAFGLTQVRLGTFVFWSWLCMLPGTVVLVVGTDAFVRGVQEERIPWAMLSIVAGALALLVASFIVVQRRFRAETAIDEDDDEENAITDPPSDASQPQTE
jgi:uncharacterized membrane protein YdjX (TVP38/TMEM64 family)